MKYLSIFFVLTLIACEKQNFTADPLHGNWEVTEYTYLDDHSIIEYMKVDDFDEKVGIVFDDEDVFKTYDHGWCGTPPLVFFFTEGKYAKIDDKVLLNINHFTFENKELEILEVTDEVLKIKMAH